MIPQIILIVLYIISLGMNIKKHGKIEEEPKNAIHSLIGIIIVFILLFLGGFFNVFFE